LQSLWLLRFAIPREAVSGLAGGFAGKPKRFNVSGVVAPAKARRLLTMLRRLATFFVPAINR